MRGDGGELGGGWGGGKVEGLGARGAHAAQPVGTSGRQHGGESGRGGAREEGQGRTNRTWSCAAHSTQMRGAGREVSTPCSRTWPPHSSPRSSPSYHSSQVGVIYDIPLKELRMFTDYGRASRPLFIVDNQRLLIRKADIIKLQVGRGESRLLGGVGGGPRGRPGVEGCEGACAWLLCACSSARQTSSSCRCVG